MIVEVECTRCRGNGIHPYAEKPMGAAGPPKCDLCNGKGSEVKEFEQAVVALLQAIASDLRSVEESVRNLPV